MCFIHIFSTLCFLPLFFLHFLWRNRSRGRQGAIFWEVSMCITFDKLLLPVVMLLVGSCFDCLDFRYMNFFLLIPYFFVLSDFTLYRIVLLQQERMFLTFHPHIIPQTSERYACILLSPSTGTHAVFSGFIHICLCVLCLLGEEDENRIFQ
jgi:hypothetical protein